MTHKSEDEAAWSRYLQLLNYTPAGRMVGALKHSFMAGRAGRASLQTENERLEISIMNANLEIDRLRQIVIANDAALKDKPNDG